MSQYRHNRQNKETIEEKRFKKSVEPQRFLNKGTKGSSVTIVENVATFKQIVGRRKVGEKSVNAPNIEDVKIRNST